MDLEGIRNVREKATVTRKEVDTVFMEKSQERAEGICPSQRNKAGLVQRRHMAKAIGNWCGINFLCINHRLQFKIL